MSNKGWIKLHRKVIDNWIWEDADKLKAWLDILLDVNHKDKQLEFEGHIITIHRGQKLTSIRKLADRWGWSRNRVDRFVGTLIEAGMVTVIRTRHGTLLTVVNYNVYQGQWDTDGATDGATVGATHEAQTRMIKNDNNSRTRARARTEKFNNHSSRNEDADELELMLLRTN